MKNFENMPKTRLMSSNAALQKGGDKQVPAPTDVCRKKLTSIRKNLYKMRIIKKETALFEGKSGTSCLEKGHFSSNKVPFLFYQIDIRLCINTLHKRLKILRKIFTKTASEASENRGRRPRRQDAADGVTGSHKLSVSSYSNLPAVGQIDSGLQVSDQRRVRTEAAALEVVDWGGR